MTIKLNIGCGPWPFEGDWINIDDGSDNFGEGEGPKVMQEMADNELGKHIPIQFQDANDLSNYDDNSVDHIFSNQCVGEYVDNYQELVRVLKQNGTIELGLWAHTVPDVIAWLTYYGIEITNVDWMNGSIDDIPDQDYTLCVKGYKK